MAADGGYAAVDALVALAILTTAIVFSVTTIHTTRRAANATLEARRSNELLQALLQRAPSEPSTNEARAGGFLWQVVVHDPVLSSGAVALCTHDASVTSIATGRRYRLSTAKICAPKPAS